MSTVFSAKRLFRLLFWIAAPLLLLACWYSPVTNQFSRLGVIVSGVMTLVGVMAEVWRFRVLRWTLTVSGLALVLFVLCPWFGHYQRSELRQAYARALAAYADTPYVWGGEGRFGMDCSGLVRRGMIDALVKEGFRQRCPALVREALWLWRHDSIARGIGNFYNGSGRTFFYEDETALTLNDLDYEHLPWGVMAANDTHIMAYLGNRQWIGADPSEGKVTIFNIPEMKNYYFSIRMKIVRWRVLKTWNGMDSGPP